LKPNPLLNLKEEAITTTFRSVDQVVFLFKNRCFCLHPNLPRIRINLLKQAWRYALAEKLHVYAFRASERQFFRRKRYHFL
jgi:hypothetical protein